MQYLKRYEMPDSNDLPPDGLKQQKASNKKGSFSREKSHGSVERFSDKRFTNLRKRNTSTHFVSFCAKRKLDRLSGYGRENSFSSSSAAEER